jgi:hypothetical protein
MVKGKKKKFIINYSPTICVFHMLIFICVYVYDIYLKELEILYLKGRHSDLLALEVLN